MEDFFVSALWAYVSEIAPGGIGDLWLYIENIETRGKWHQSPDKLHTSHVNVLFWLLLFISLYNFAMYSWIFMVTLILKYLFLPFKNDGGRFLLRYLHNSMLDF